MKLIDSANKVDQILNRFMPLCPILGVALGVFLTQVFLDLRPFVPWLFGTMTLSGALKLRVKELGRAASSPLPFFLFFLNAHILMPLVVFFFSKLIFSNDLNTISGFVLQYSVPTAVTSFVWVSIFRGDLALVLAMILLNTILAPLLVPGTVQLLLGSSITLNMTGMVISLLLMIVIPTVAGVATNELSRGKIPSLIGPLLSPFAKICMVLVIAVNSAAVAPQLRFDNSHIWIIVAACICFNIVGFIFGKFIGVLGKLDKEKQISLFLSSGLKNSSAAMTIGIEFFPVSTVLPSVLGIMTQHTIVAIMGRILTKNSQRVSE